MREQRWYELGVEGRLGGIEGGLGGVDWGGLRWMAGGG